MLPAGLPAARAGDTMSATSQPPEGTPVDTSVASTSKPVPLVMQIAVRRDLLAVSLRSYLSYLLFTT